MALISYYAKSIIVLEIRFISCFFFFDYFKNYDKIFEEMKDIVKINYMVWL